MILNKTIANTIFPNFSISEKVVLNLGKQFFLKSCTSTVNAITLYRRRILRQNFQTVIAFGPSQQDLETNILVSGSWILAAESIQCSMFGGFREITHIDLLVQSSAAQVERPFLNVVIVSKSTQHSASPTKLKLAEDRQGSIFRIGKHASHRICYIMKWNMMTALHALQVAEY